jgi:AraC-like DNA-binding protein
MNRISTASTTKTFHDALWHMHELRPATVVAHNEAVDRVIRTMHERLDEPLTLQEMSRIAYISPYHFNRIFRQITGIPPNQFLYALRLETAKRRLLMSNTSVTDVCFDVGYNSLGTFIRRFTALVGVSPSRLRDTQRLDSLSRRSVPLICRQHRAERVFREMLRRRHGSRERSSWDCLRLRSRRVIPFPAR